MALLHSEVAEIYAWMQVSWPTVLSPVATEDFVRMKHRQIMADFGKYDKETVLAALGRWRENNEKFPTTKNLVNEIEWMRKEEALKHAAEHPEDGGWPMEIIYDNGDEACYGVFNRERFVNHAKNPEHLQPEEWLRRFRIRRAGIDYKLGRISEGRYQAFMQKERELADKAERLGVPIWQVPMEAKA